MNQAPGKNRPFLAVLSATAGTLFAPSCCRAASQANLPWDSTLDAIQNFVAGPLAHSVILVSGVGAALAFGFAGDNDLARSLAKAMLGTGLALLAVQLLNYLAL
jgi:type IV secretory pathway VirB2 component (pilin)